MKYSYLLLLSASTLAALPQSAPDVISGSVTMVEESGSLRIETSSCKSVLHWNDFSIQATESVHFAQPSEISSVLNRVVGGSLTEIHGHLTSNGQVWLVNPAGIYMGPNAVIDTAGFLAAAFDVLTEDFLAESTVRFQGEAGQITHLGKIYCPYGTVHLLAKNVDNKGSIDAANLEIGAGPQFLLAREEAKEAFIQVDPNFEAETPHAHAIQMGGKTHLKEGGKLLLYSHGDLSVDGKIEGESLTADLLGNRISIEPSAQLDVPMSEVRIGGTAKGLDRSVPHAEWSWVKEGALIDLSGKECQDGGSLVLWGDKAVQFLGTIQGGSGPLGGLGGNVEVSSHGYFCCEGQIDLRGINGNGTLLWDPIDVTISGAATTGGVDLTTTPVTFPAAATANILNTALQSQLELSAVEINAISSGTVGNGDVSFTAGVTWTAENSLTITARSISIDANIDAGGSIVFTTNGGAGTFNGIELTAGNTLNLGAGFGSITLTGVAGSAGGNGIDISGSVTRSGFATFNLTGTAASGTAIHVGATGSVGGIFNTFIGDTIEFEGPIGGAGNTIRPLTAGRAMNINTGSGGLFLSAATLSELSTNNGTAFGNSSTGAIAIGDFSTIGGAEGITIISGSTVSVVGDVSSFSVQITSQGTTTVQGTGSLTATTTSFTGISITAGAVALNGPVTISGSGSLQLAPFDSMSTVGIGSAATGTFKVVESDFANITCSRLQIGTTSSSGPTDVQLSSSPSFGLTIYSPQAGGAISINSALAVSGAGLGISLYGESVAVNGNVTPGMGGAFFLESTNQPTFGMGVVISTTGTATLSSISATNTVGILTSSMADIQYTSADIAHFSGISNLAFIYAGPSATIGNSMTPLNFSYGFSVRGTSGADTLTVNPAISTTVGSNGSIGLSGYTLNLGGNLSAGGTGGVSIDFTDVASTIFDHSFSGGGEFSLNFGGSILGIESIAGPDVNVTTADLMKIENGFSSYAYSTTSGTVQLGPHNFPASLLVNGGNSHVYILGAVTVPSGESITLIANTLVSLFDLGGAPNIGTLSAPGSGTIRLATNGIAFSGPANTVTGGGTLAFESGNSANEIGVNFSPSLGLNVDSATLAQCTGFNLIQIGSEEQTGTITTGMSTTFGTSVTILCPGGEILNNGTVATSSGSIQFKSETFSIGSSVTSAGDITITTDTLVNMGGNFNGSQNMIVQPLTPSRNIGINFISDGLNLDYTFPLQITNGFSLITIGAADGSGTVTIGTQDMAATTFNDPLLIRSPSGAIEFSGAIAAAGIGTSLAFTAGAISFNTGYDIDTVQGNITFTGPVTLNAAGTVSVGGAAGNITFSGSGSTINGGQNLTLNAGTSTGTLTLGGTVGGTTRIGSLVMGPTQTVSAGAITAGRIALNGVTTTTASFGALNTNTASGIILNSATLNLNGSVTAANSSSAFLTLTANTLNIASTLSGTGFLTISPRTNSRNIGINVVTGQLDLSTSVIQDGFSSIEIGSVVATGTISVGTATFSDSVTLRTAGGGSISLSGAVATSGLSNTLALSSGNLTFGSGSSLTTNQGAISIGVTTITLNSPVALSTGALGGGNIGFSSGGNINGNAAGMQNLQLTAGTGNITFPNNVGVGVRLGALTVISATNVTSNGTINANSINVNGTGTLNLQTINTTEVAGISLSGAALNTGGNLSASGAGPISLTADSMSIGALLIGTSTVVVRPLTDSTNIDIATSTGGMEVNYLSFTDGFSSITIGSPTGTGTVTIGNAIFSDPLLIGPSGFSGTIDLQGQLETSSVGDSLTLNGSLIQLNGGGLSTNGGDLSLSAPVSLLMPATFSTGSGTGDIIFSSTINGESLTLAADGGNISFGGAIGSLMTPFGTLTIDTVADVDANGFSMVANSVNQLAGSGTSTFSSLTGTGGQFTFTGTTFDFAGPVSVATQSFTLTNSGVATFTDTVATTNSDLVLLGSGSVVFEQTISITDGTLSLGNGGLVTFEGAVSITGMGMGFSQGSGTPGPLLFQSSIAAANGIDVYGPIELGGNSSLTSSAGAISINNTVDGAFNLTANAFTTISFGMSIGMTTPLGVFALEGAPSMAALSGNVTASAIHINVPSSYLSAGVTLTSNGSAGISLIADTIVGPFLIATAPGPIFLKGNSITINSFSGESTLGIEPLADSTTIGVNDSSATLQVVSGLLSGTLFSELTIGSSTGSGTITVGTDGAASFPFDTMIRSPDGTIILEGELSTTGGSSDLILEASVIEFQTNNNLATAGGDLTFDGSVSLLANSAIATSGGDIIFEGVVDGARELTLAAGAGDVVFNGNVGGMNPITNLLFTSGAEIEIGANIQVSGDNPLDFSLPVLMTGTSVITSNHQQITFQNTINGAGSLTINAGMGSIFFQQEIGGTIRLTHFEVTGGTIYVPGAISTDGNTQEYFGPVLLFGPTVLSELGGDILFHDIVDGVMMIPQDLSVTAVGGEVVFDSTVSVDELSVAGEEGVTCDGLITAASSVSISSSDGDVSVNGITGGADITLQPGAGFGTLGGLVRIPDGILRIGTAEISAVGALNLSAIGRSQLLSVATIEGRGNVTLTGDSLLIGSNEVFTVLGDVSIEMTTGVSTGPLISTGTINFGTTPTVDIYQTLPGQIYSSFGVLYSDLQTSILSATALPVIPSPTYSGMGSAPIVEQVIFSPSAFEDLLLYEGYLLNFDEATLPPPPSPSSFGVIETIFNNQVAVSEMLEMRLPSWRDWVSFGDRIIDFVPWETRLKEFKNRKREAASLLIRGE